MWERTTAIGTVILIVLTIVAISQGPPITWLHWPGFILPPAVVAGLIVAAALNFRTARLRRAIPEPSAASYPPSPAADHVAFVVSSGCALETFRYGVVAHLLVFSSGPAELVYSKVTLSGRAPDGGNFSLNFDNSEPIMLEPMTLTPMKVEKAGLTGDQMQFVNSGAALSGYVRLKYGHEQKVVQFSLRS
jgi:hypothetical protein